MADQKDEEKAAAAAEAAAQEQAAKDAAEEVAAPACPVCDTKFFKATKLPESALSVRCPTCKTHSHVSDLTGERREYLKAQRRRDIEAAMAKAASSI